MLRLLFFRFFIAAGLLCSAAAWAQEAYTTRQVNVRAGPDQEYPMVAVFAPGTPVTVVGCVSDYRWCDVYYGDVRGWVYARSLDYVYQSRRVPIYGYGPTIGLPIVTFSLLPYWDNYYRNRPFYRDYPRWENRRYRDGPVFVAPYGSREPQYRQGVSVEPQYRQPRQYDPQYRQPRAVEPQNRPSQGGERQRVQPQPPQQAQPQPQIQPQQRSSGGQQGSRPAQSSGERPIDRTPSRQGGDN